MDDIIQVHEHNLDVIKTADWLVDMGPEGGDGGGEVAAVGTPEEVAACERSHTGQFLREVMGLETAYQHEMAQPLREVA